MSRLITVLIPAHNEADYITACLQAVFASKPLPKGMTGEVLVLANGCTDSTAEMARKVPAAGGWALRVLDMPEGGKLKALNAGDAIARGEILIYLDADVVVDPSLIPEIAVALDRNTPRYASGRPMVASANSWLTRAYGRFWQQLPFVTQGTPGFGLFAMTRAGRQRWQDWPDIISDDTFARLNFTPAERLSVTARYHWPMVEGLANLVRVRRRQNIGVEEIGNYFPKLLKNNDKISFSLSDLLRLATRDPVGFGVYGLVSLLVKTPLFHSKSRWVRGR